MAAAGGRAHGAAVGEDGALFVWGDGHDGQLGTGDTANRLAAPMCVDGLPAPVRQVAAGACHAGIVTDAGDLLMRGNREFGKHRATPTLVARALFDGEAMLMVDCGAFHSAALTEGGGVYTFGDGQDGRLGHGDRENQLVLACAEAGAGGGVQRRAGLHGGCGRCAHGGAERGGARGHTWPRRRRKAGVQR